jgi:hypothetical protein
MEATSLLAVWSLSLKDVLELDESSLPVLDEAWLTVLDAALPTVDTALPTVFPMLPKLILGSRVSSLTSLLRVSRWRKRLGEGIYRELILFQ